MLYEVITYEKLFEQIKKDGYSRIRLNGEIVSLDEDIPPLDRQKWHNIEIVVDRIQTEKSERSRLFEAIQTAIKASKGDVMISSEKEEKIFSQNNACPYCGLTIGDRITSYNVCYTKLLRLFSIFVYYGCTQA